MQIWPACDVLSGTWLRRAWWKSVNGCGRGNPPIKAQVIARVQNQFLPLLRKTLMDRLWLHPSSAHFSAQYSFVDVASSFYFSGAKVGYPGSWPITTAKIKCGACFLYFLISLSWNVEVVGSSQAKGAKSFLSSYQITLCKFYFHRLELVAQFLSFPVFISNLE